MSTKPKCPLCKKPSADATKPFCSKKCQQIDLGRWLKGIYAIPVRETEEDDSLS
ncbi:MAG: DNA gyrase inhibitor YacG [Robiginitomaculum sp.]|nr:DNA gyrase inhibitor YacG [Robiginitomaculum sp.]